MFTLNMTNFMEEFSDYKEKSRFRTTNLPIKDSYNQNRSPVKVLVLTRQPTLFDFIPFLFMLAIYALIIQTLCLVVKKTSKRMYDIIVFLTLLTAPPVILISTGYLMFPSLWGMFIIPMIILYYKINTKPLQKDLPRKVFGIFKTLFILTNIGIFILQSCTIISFYLFPTYLVSSFLSLLAVVYFALLSRETVYFLSESMASNTGFYSKEGVPKRNDNNTLCMICTKLFDKTELIHTLLCNHSFHENCIKGWCIIAKKDTCPFCKKGVNLDLIPKDIWYKSEIWFYPLINTLRGFIVFFVSMIVISYYKLSK